MDNIINKFEPITLSEMSSIKLMNRTDTKFVTSLSKLNELLSMAVDEYKVQQTAGERIISYYTLYFDTPDNDMFMAHHNCHAVRQKLRIRSYVNSGCSFLEVKTKDNHRRTSKVRIAMNDFIMCAPQNEILFGKHDEKSVSYDDFLLQNLRYPSVRMREKLENRFRRITLVNKFKTERLTIDIGLNFNNITTGCHANLNDTVVIELKRDGQAPSPILNMLMQLRIMPLGFSKYCIGQVLTDSSLKCNMFKNRMHMIEKAVSAV